MPIVFYRNINLFSGIATEMSVWDGVVVSPHERAYVKPEKKESEDAAEDQANMDQDVKP